MVVFKLFHGDVIPWIDYRYWWLYGPFPNPNPRFSYGVCSKFLVSELFPFSYSHFLL